MKIDVSHLDTPAWDIKVLQMPRFLYARTYWCYVLVLQCAPNYEGKGKVHPITGHKSPEGELRCSSTLSLTSALDVGGWSTPRPGSFTRGKDPVPIV
jgi:hypothetical protein